MARIAGSKGYYPVSLLDVDGNPIGEVHKLYSVTTIISKVIAKPALYGWYWKITMDGVSKLASKYGASLPADLESLKSLMSTEGLSPYKVRNAAGAAGTRVHDDMEKLCKGKVVKKTETNEGLLNWWEERELSKKDILACEYPLVSLKHELAGTLDMVYSDPSSGATVLTDLKTGFVGWEAFVQGNAYRMMADDQHLFGGIDRVSVLHVRPIGEGKLANGWEELVAPDVGVDTFLHIKAIFDALPFEIKEYEDEESEVNDARTS